MNKSFKNQIGFAVIELVFIFIGIAAIGGVGYAVLGHNNKQPVNTTSQPATKSTPVKNPFPAKPTVSAAGAWHGQFTIKAPAACAGHGGGWQATLKDTDGTITGDYTADGGFSGPVNGTVTADKASFSVTNAASGVISFTGNISGNTISGDFTGVSCSGHGTDDRTTGTFFGGRTV